MYDIYYALISHGFYAYDTEAEDNHWSVWNCYYDVWEAIDLDDFSNLVRVSQTCDLDIPPRLSTSKLLSLKLGDLDESSTNDYRDEWLKVFGKLSDSIWLSFEAQERFGKILMPRKPEEALKHKIKCLENKIEHFENLPSEYKYLWDKDWDEMSYEEQGIYYKSTPAAKLEPMKYDETVEEYLRRHSVLDGMGNMDGSFVPLSVAMIAVEKILKYELQYKPPSWIR